MAMRTIPHRLLWPLDRGLRGAVRGIAFTGKELHEVLRQARLLLALVAGPFLILLLFGTSYRGEVVQQPTVLVVPASTGFSTNVQDYRTPFSSRSRSQASSARPKRRGRSSTPGGRR